MMYAYVTCRPDIGYAITTMSKFSTTPTFLHYQYLKHVAKYLRATKHWGIRYKRSKLREDLPPPEFDSIPPVENAANDLPDFSVDIRCQRLMKLYSCTDPNYIQGEEIFTLEWRCSNYILITNNMYCRSRSRLAYPPCEGKDLLIEQLRLSYLWF